MNAKTYSLSVAKMIAGSKSKKGTKHIAVPVSADLYMVVVEADWLTVQAAAKQDKPASKRRTAKVDTLVTATLPLMSGDVEANKYWVGAINEAGKVCWFLKSTVTQLDLEARTVTVVIPSSKAQSAARKAVNWTAVAG